MENMHHLEDILLWIGSKIRIALIGINCSSSNCANAIKVSIALHSEVAPDRGFAFYTWTNDAANW